MKQTRHTTENIIRILRESEAAGATSAGRLTTGGGASMAART